MSPLLGIRSLKFSYLKSDLPKRGTNFLRPPPSSQLSPKLEEASYHSSLPSVASSLHFSFQQQKILLFGECLFPRESYCQFTKKNFFFFLICSACMNPIVQSRLFSFFILLLFEIVWISIRLSTVTSFYGIGSVLYMFDCIPFDS